MDTITRLIFEIVGCPREQINPNLGVSGLNEEV